MILTRDELRERIIALVGRSEVDGFPVILGRKSKFLGIRMDVVCDLLFSEIDGSDSYWRQKLAHDIQSVEGSLATNDYTLDRSAQYVGFNSRAYGG